MKLEVKGYVNRRRRSIHGLHFQSLVYAEHTDDY